MSFTPGWNPDRQSRVAQDAQNGGALGSSQLLLATRRSIAPNADVAAGGWTTDTGATTNLYQAIDESTPSDADYVQSSLAPTSDVYTLGFPPSDAPIAGLRLLRYRYDKDSASAQIDLTVELLQGLSVIQTWTHTNIPTDWVGADQEITGAITDYSTLSVRLTANQV